MRDIETRNDIITFVDRFYSKVDTDPVLGPIFNDQANVDWDQHKDKLYKFWASIALATGEYKGQPFPAHVDLMPLTRDQFKHWLNLFLETVDELFEGEQVHQMKKSAQNIANVLMMKLGVIKNEVINTVE
jgi:hemoglobin